MQTGFKFNGGWPFAYIPWISASSALSKTAARCPNASATRGLIPRVLLYLCLSIPLPHFALAQKIELAQAEQKNNDQDSALNLDNLLILQIDLGQYILADALTGYLNGGSLLLPLSEFVEVLDFAIGVSPGTGTANGWFIRENQLFSLDINSGEVVIGGKKERFDPGLVAVFEDDIYIDVRILATWFPVDIRFDLSNLLVKLKSREPLPIEQRLARDTQRKKLLAQKRQDDPQYSEIPQPYQVISWPSSYSSMEFSLNQSESGQVKGLRQTTFWSADVGKLSAELFLNADDQTIIPQARLKFGRKDIKGELLGAAKATEFAFGDISTPQFSSISNSNLGRGLIVSNFPLDKPTEFDRITLEGDLPSGWEVELYRNEVLLDFRTARADGRYVFEDVPLLFGVNVLRLTSFGPQGQTRDEIRQIRVGPDQIKPGSHHYRFAVNQQETQTLIGRIDTPSDPDLQGKLRFFSEYETGITRNLSMSANFASIPMTGGHGQYATLSGRAAIGNLFGRVDVTRDLSQGWATKIAAQTAIAGITVISEHDRLYDFVSEKYAASDDPTEHNTNVRLEGTVNVPKVARIPFSLTADHEQTKSGGTTTALSNRLSAPIRATTVSNTLKWSLIKSETAPRTTTMDGSFLLGGTLGKVRLRGQLGYTVDPIADFTTSSLSADYSLSKDTNASAGINVDLSENGVTTFTTGLNSTFDLAAVGINADYDTAKNFNARLTLSFSSARDPRDNSMVLRARNLAESAALSVRVFLDENSNGVFDDGDTPLEGVGFKAGRTELRQKTNKKGLAYVSGLETYSAINFSIDQGTLDDPFWVPTPEGVSVTLRPGVPGRVDFPVITTGEIDGTVYRRSGEWAREVKDVVIQLVDKDGTVVKQVKSSFDGFYLLDYITPGNYTLRIDPEQVLRLKLSKTPEQQVNIKGDGTVLSGLDFVLETERVEQTYRLRLIAYKTRDEALGEWAKLKKDFPDALKDMKPMLELNDRGGDDGVVFDLYAGPIISREAANRLCVTVRAKRGEIWCNPMTIQTR